jgi:hypothetical protein
VGLLHRPYADMGYFRCARQTERVSHHFRHVLRLREQFGLIGAALLIKQPLHAGRGGAAGINAQDPDAVGVHFIAQAVRDGAKGVLGRGELADGGGGTESSG